MPSDIRRHRTFAEKVEEHFGFLRAEFGFLGPEEDAGAFLFDRPDFRVELLRDPRTDDVFLLLWRIGAKHELPAEEGPVKRPWVREDLADAAARFLPGTPIRYSVTGRTRHCLDRSLTGQAEVLVQVLQVLGVRAPQTDGDSRAKTERGRPG
ncbi:hypothetical protein [Sinosporangium siamense]|uniref:Uncharacterized protein n=1 Tax=Sinosporangium siamense TaxID=1367973 RepID=A0A919VEE3_9ACTN|nr:hypothetical protein [Sinosporangium siamense]GII95044.1 hypothetical protein Ssi02_52750 [Sinosporangium siamense]